MVATSGGHGGGGFQGDEEGLILQLWSRYFEKDPYMLPSRRRGGGGGRGGGGEPGLRDNTDWEGKTEERRENVLAFARLFEAGARAGIGGLPGCEDFNGGAAGIALDADRIILALGSLERGDPPLRDGPQLRGRVRSLLENLRLEPRDALGCIGLGLCVAAQRLRPRVLVPQNRVYWPRISPSVGFESTPLGNLGSSLVGHFVSVSGAVVRAGALNLMPLRARFRCEKCGHVSDDFIQFRDAKYDVPTRCTSMERCKSRTFDVVRSSAEEVDSQTLTIQELEGENWQSGKLHSTARIELAEDLVSSTACVPGDQVTVYGVVCCDNAETAKGKTSKTAKSSGEYLIYIRANRIVNHSRRGAAEDSSFLSSAASLLNERDYDMIRSVASLTSPFACLVASLCPGIFGQELVKAGLLLSLLGGSKKVDGTTDVAVRSDIHALIVGDPGLGKSQLLRAVHSVAPRSVYVGSNTSKSGLTATMTKDGLEAGALVLADEGVCCIDEFDKLNCDPRALLEAMEQQQVTIAKSGILASLNARCSVIAAANPVGGHYDKSKTVSQNIRMNAALLSRFDLVFILIDRPDESYDRLLSKHVMENSAVASAHHHAYEGRGGGGGGGGGGGDPNLSSLSHRLRREVSHLQSNHERLAHENLRKYIAYARTYCHPRLSSAAAKVLQQLYMKMRRESSEDGTPITTRQLESLIRLSQAWARAELREEVTAAHARAVVDLMQESTMDAELLDENVPGLFGMERRAPSRRRNSQRGQRDVFLEKLRELTNAKGSNLLTEGEMKETFASLRTLSSQRGETFDISWTWLLENLRDEVYILQRGPRLFSLQRDMIV